MPLPEKDVSQYLLWRPWNHGDPPPWILDIIRELEQHARVQVGMALVDAEIVSYKALIDAELVIHKARVEGLQKIREVMVAAAKTR